MEMLYFANLNTSPGTLVPPTTITIGRFLSITPSDSLQDSPYIVRWTISPGLPSPASLANRRRNDNGLVSYRHSKSPPNLSLTDLQVSKADSSSSPARITSSAPKALAVKPRWLVMRLSRSLRCPNLSTETLRFEEAM